MSFRSAIKLFSSKSFIVKSIFYFSSAFCFFLFMISFQIQSFCYPSILIILFLFLVPFVFFFFFSHVFLIKDIPWIASESAGIAKTQRWQCWSPIRYVIEQCLLCPGVSGDDIAFANELQWDTQYKVSTMLIYSLNISDVGW